MAKNRTFYFYLLIFYLILILYSTRPVLSRKSMGITKIKEQ
jgi:hypothetical protein